MKNGANARAAEPWPARGFEAQRERSCIVEKIDGQLPAELRGTFYRIGPGSLDVFGDSNRHWFDGDGLICAFRFDGERPRFRCRYVGTPSHLREQSAGRRLYSTFATVTSGLRALGPRKNPANTNCLIHDGKLLALFESARPFALAPDTLDPLGAESFSGTLPRYAMFSAHPHRDQHSGALISAGLGFRIGSRDRRPGLWPVVETWEVSTSGRACRGIALPLRHADVIHSVGMTQRSLVVLAGPYGLDWWKVPGFVTGRNSLFDCVKWRPRDPLLAYVADRTGREPPRIYELDTQFMIHVANAYEDADGVIIDAILYEDPGLVEALRLPISQPATRPGRLTRIRLGRDGRASSQSLSETGVEFPSIDVRCDGRRYRFAYAGRFEVDGKLQPSQSLVKIDVDRGATTEVHLGEGCIFGEPVFVPRTAASKEDEGWILSLAYDGRDHHSFLAVLRAETLQEVARLHLPFHVPMGLHAAFAPADQDVIRYPCGSLSEDIRTTSSPSSTEETQFPSTSFRDPPV